MKSIDKCDIDILMDLYLYEIGIKSMKRRRLWFRKILENHPIKFSLTLGIIVIFTLGISIIKFFIIVVTQWITIKLLSKQIELVKIYEDNVDGLNQLQKRYNLFYDPLNNKIIPLIPSSNDIKNNLFDEVNNNYWNILLDIYRKSINDRYWLKLSGAIE